MCSTLVNMRFPPQLCSCTLCRVARPPFLRLICWMRWRPLWRVFHASSQPLLNVGLPHAACRCLEQYECLLTPIKKEFIRFTSQRVNVHWPTPSNLDDFAGMGDPMNNSDSLDDISYVGSIFDSTGLSSASEVFGLPTAMPNDWNAEFDFGMHGTF